MPERILSKELPKKSYISGKASISEQLWVKSQSTQGKTKVESTFVFSALKLPSNRSLAEFMLANNGRSQYFPVSFYKAIVIISDQGHRRKSQSNTPLCTTDGLLLPLITSFPSLSMNFLPCFLYFSILIIPLQFCFVSQNHGITDCSELERALKIQFQPPCH